VRIYTTASVRFLTEYSTIPSKHISNSATAHPADSGGKIKRERGKGTEPTTVTARRRRRKKKEKSKVSAEIKGNQRNERNVL
jgi:hypothetical protein